MKTAADMLDRMEALCRKLAECKHSGVYIGHPTPEKTQGYVAGDILVEARAIVAELPEPVDPDLATAQHYYDEWVQDVETGHMTVDAMAYALRRAREEGTK